jgi:hypothetical protein
MVLERHMRLVLVRIFESPVVFIFESENMSRTWPAQQHTMHRTIRFHTLGHNAPWLKHEILLLLKISKIGRAHV